MFKRLFVIAVLVIAAGCSKSPEQKAKAEFAQGQQLVEEGKTGKADSVFHQLIADAPNSPIGVYGGGLIQERQTQIYDALGVYLKVNKLDRRFSPALMSTGRIFRFLHEYDLAAAAYLEASHLPDSPAVAMTLMAAVACDDWRPGQALKSLRAADSLGADKHLTTLISARALALRVKLDSADATYAQAFSGAKQTAVFWSMAADYLETRGLADSAIKTSLQSTQQGDSRFEHSYAHFQRCLRLGYFWAARQCLSLVTGGDSTSLTQCGLMIQYGLAAGDAYSADHANNRFMKSGNNSISTYMYDSDVRLRIGDIQSVMQNSELVPSMAVEGGDTTAFARYLQGMVLLRYPDVNDPGATAAKLATTSGFAADRRDYKLAYITQMELLGAAEPLEASIKILETGHGNEADWLTGLGDVTGAKLIRHYDAAEAYYRRALKIDPNYVPAIRRAVEMYMRAASYDKALAILDEHSAVSEAFTDLALKRAECLVQTGQIETGVNVFQATLPKVCGKLDRVEEMSRLLQAKGHPDLDGNLIRSAVALNSGNPDALLLAAIRDNDYGNAQSALESAEAGLAIEPGNIHLQVQKARATRGKGDKQAAYALFDDLAKHYSTDVEVNLYYSSILAEDRVQFPRAENLARAANIWEVGSHRVVSNLTFVFLQSGRYDVAASEAQSALVSHPDWSDIQFTCGAALFAQGKKEARQYLQKALDLGLPTQQRDKAKELLNKL